MLGTAAGEKHRASSLNSGPWGPGYRPGRPQAARSNWVPVASVLSQTCKNAAKGEEACFQQVRRASWRRRHELSYDSWNQGAINRTRQPSLPLPDSCSSLASCLTCLFPITLQGESCPLLILDETTEAQRGYRATQLVTGRAQVGAVSLWGTQRINHCHSRPYVL